MKLNVQKYFETSTIHGLFYISTRYHIVERIYWILALVLSIACTSLLIAKLAIKMYIDPIVVYVADQPISVTKIPFPAVTICPQLMPYFKFDASSNPKRVYRFDKHTGEKYLFENEEFWDEIEDERRLGNLKFSKVFHPYNKNVFGNFSYLTTLKQLENGSIKPEELGLKILKRLQVIDLVTQQGVFSKLNFSIPADDFLDYINHFTKEFEDYPTSFESTFNMISPSFVSEILTSNGLCYTINQALSQGLLKLNSTSHDFHYQLHMPGAWGNLLHRKPTELPIHGFSANTELIVDVLTITEDMHEIILNDLDGLLVYIHDPFELSLSNSRKFVIRYERDVTIWTNARMNQIDESLRDYTPEQRNCYLDQEKELKFFKVYTKSNCQMECQSDFTISRCGCVEFFMIRNSTTRICMASEKNCTETAQSDFPEVKNECKCLHPCNYLEYTFDSDEQGFLKKNEMPEFGEEVRVSRKNDAQQLNRIFYRFPHNDYKIEKFRVKFAQKDFELFIRKKHFNMLDFFSFAGGILGLFAGFSALSFVEVIYWFTIRVILERFNRNSSKVSPVDVDLQIKDIFRSFMDNSSMHGLKHIFNHSKLDSLLWIIFIIASLTVCSGMIRGVREKVPNSRVIVYDDNFALLENIPFPAITFIPEYYWPDEFSVMDFQNLKADNYQLYKNQTEQAQFEKNLTNEKFCFLDFDMYFYKANISFIPYILKVLKEHSMIDWFRTQFSSFNQVYQPEYAEIRTIRGMGFAFNLIDSYAMFNLNQLSEHYNYTRNVTTVDSNLMKIPASAHPLKFSSLENPVLKIKLKRLKTKEFVCILPSFLVHSSDYLPTFSELEEFVHFQYGMEIYVEVTPKIIRTDESLRKLAPDQRECYFEGEKFLKYFKIYSERNCEIECYTNFTISACGCTDINQPFESESQMCRNISKTFYLPYYCAMGIKRDLDASEYFSPAMNCSCLPTCNSVTYNVKYNAEFNTKGSRVGRTGNETTLNVWMNMDEILLLRRYQQFTTSDVISYVGGLLGLFAGISMLSIVEFVYFFTLRIGSDLCRVMMKRNKRKIVNWVNK